MIIGAGVAGLTAGLYGSRYGLDTLVLEKNQINGQLSFVDTIENFPGFGAIEGIELMNKIEKHALENGLSIERDNVKNLVVDANIKILHTEKRKIESRTVIVATGANPSLLNVPGEKEFTGKGVSYCATCDGPLFRNKDVAVVGGGNSAIAEALVLSSIANKVYVIHRRDTLKAEMALQKRALKTDNIIFLWNSEIKKVFGEKLVEGLHLKNLTNNELFDLSVNGLFVYVGVRPNTEQFDINKDENGFIVTETNMQTSVPGVFAAGDCRLTPLRQAITASSDGSIAAYSANNYIKEI